MKLGVHVSKNSWFSLSSVKGLEGQGLSKNEHASHMRLGCGALLSTKAQWHLRARTNSGGGRNNLRVPGTLWVREQGCLPRLLGPSKEDPSASQRDRDCQTEEHLDTKINNRHNELTDPTKEEIIAPC